ncbi:hypothetical protein BASA81_002412 [Batrachochytrium salamandrivorans]|nr:hypothetical protein BASA81_002412 [Batrachochytrium salamandrivorans]
MSLRETVVDLVQRKVAMEAELEAIMSELNSGASPVGLVGNLIDSEGFPRNDVDIMRVATLRNRRAVLVTDTKQILKEIEAGLHELHAEAKPTIQSRATTTAAATETGEEEQAFLRVNTVAFDSPAYSAGLREGDVIYRFGKLRWADFQHVQLAGVATEVVEAKPLRIFFRRQGGKKTCTLLPQRWEGKGLLGCHLVPC